MKTVLSEKQIDFLCDSTHDINIATGAIRSGKTHDQLIRVLEFIMGDDSEPNIPILAIAKTLEAARRNLFNDFIKMYREQGAEQYFTYTKMPLEITYTPKNISIPFVGANDDSAEGKIRGMTCQAVFGDEITLWPRNIFEQCLGRASAGKRWKWFTCNPDRPSHYIKTDYIDNPNVDCKTWHFTFEDNPILSEEYKASMRNLMTGAMKERMIYGKWVPDVGGLVYSAFNRERHCIPHEQAQKLSRAADDLIIGIDWGFTHPMAMVQVHRLGERYLITDIYHEKNKTIGVKWIMEDFFEFSRNAGTAICDNARPELIEYCNEGYKDDTVHRIDTRFYPCHKHAGSLNDEIETIQRLLLSDRLLVDENCKQLIIEFESWTKKENKEKPHELDEDTLRAMGYAIMSIERGHGEIIVV